MNVLLGGPAWHSIAKRAETPSSRFDPVIVRAFYDDIESAPSNTFGTPYQSAETMRLPSAGRGLRQGCLMVGTTGAGKTSLAASPNGLAPRARPLSLRPQPPRTTICDIEVVTAADLALSGSRSPSSTSGRSILTSTNASPTPAPRCGINLPDNRFAERLLGTGILAGFTGLLIEGSWNQLLLAARKQGGTTRTTIRDSAAIRRGTGRAPTAPLPTAADIDADAGGFRSPIARPGEAAVR